MPFTRRKKYRLSIFLFFAIAVCSAISAFAQTDYRNGYIVTPSMDTVFGLVNYRDGVKRFKTCDFKKSENGTAVTYEPQEIIAYGLKGDRAFESRKISIKDQPESLGFLEVIVEGYVTLYKFDNNYFIEKDKGGLNHLPSKVKDVYVKGQVLQHTNMHIGILNMLLFDCAEIRTRIQKTKLQERPLTSLVESYNRCKGGTSITFKNSKPWTKAVIGAAGGVNISEIRFKTVPGYEHLGGTFSTSTSPLAGVSFDVLSPRLNERISFHGDVVFVNSRYYDFLLLNKSLSTERNYVTIELQQLKIPVGLRYTFPERKFTLYVNAGISNTIHLGSNSTWIREVETSNLVETHEDKALEITKGQIGVWGGCGFVRSINSKVNGFVELRYERTNGGDPAVVSGSLHSQITNFQILIGIRTK